MENKDTFQLHIFENIKPNREKEEDYSLFSLQLKTEWEEFFGWKRKRATCSFSVLVGNDYEEEEEEEEK